MDAVIDIEIAEDADEHPPSAQIKQWLNSVLAFIQEKHVASIPDTPELSLLICSSPTIQELNATYRQKEKPTNVLSFPAELDPIIDISLLGDIILCSEVINEEAKQQEKDNAAHWLHMLTHGCLHLLGFDHINSEDAEIMESLEIEFLKQHNISNPYLIQDNENHHE